MKIYPTDVSRCLAQVFCTAFLGAILTLGAPAQAAEYGGFFEFTVYTQDGEPAEAYKPNVIVMFHGFKSAMPNDDYRIFLEAFGETHTVVGFNYHYTDVAADLAELDELHAKFLKDRNLIVVGTSLGGFWANYFANRVGASGLILVNPTIDPQDTMRRALGEQYSKKRQQNFIVTEEAVEAYGQVQPRDNPETRKLVLLALDDKILNPQRAKEVFAETSQTEVVLVETGGHNLPLDEPGNLSVIRRFVEIRSVKN